MFQWVEVICLQERIGCLSASIIDFKTAVWVDKDFSPSWCKSNNIFCDWTSLPQDNSEKDNSKKDKVNSRLSASENANLRFRRCLTRNETSENRKTKPLKLVATRALNPVAPSTLTTQFTTAAPSTVNPKTSEAFTGKPQTKRSFHEQQNEWEFRFCLDRGFER